MKVCLVSPATATDFSESQIASSGRVRGVVEHPPLGILILAAVLLERGIEVRVVHLNRAYLEFRRTKRHSTKTAGFEETVARMLADLPADIFGFGTLCSSYYVTLRIAASLGALRTDVPLILGGPQASVVDVATLKAFPCLSCIVRGEAEETLPQLLDALAAHRQPAHVPGVTYYDHGTIVRNQEAAVIADLDAVPAPAYNLWPFLHGWHTLPLELGRGCPYGCTFCSTSRFFQRKYRVKSPDAMIRQMRFFNQTRGISRFNLIHDSFLASRKKVIEFCDALGRGDEKFSWYVSARTDCLDDELILRMARSGCRGVFLGVETGSPDLQEAIHKRLDVAGARRAVRGLDRCGIKSVVSLIVGFPEETRETLKQTIDFLADSIRCESVEPQFHILAPLPGTPIYCRHSKDLRLDDHYSDISSQGVERSPADLEMIRSFPSLFASYYYIPTPALDREYLVELRNFIVAAIEFHWLFVALHQSAGSALPLFDLWRTWHSKLRPRRLAHGGPERYYRSRRFRRDFLDFLKSEYIPARGKDAPLLSALAECELRAQKLHRRGRRDTRFSRPLRFDDVPAARNGVAVFEVGVDLERLIRCLRRKGRMDHVPRTPATIALRAFGGGVERLQLAPDSSRLFRLCDGVRTARQVVRAFAACRTAPIGIPISQAAEYGLLYLQQQHLIEAGPRLRKSADANVDPFVGASGFPFDTSMKPGPEERCHNREHHDE